MNIFVSNISFKKSESDLKDLFSEFGVVEKYKIVLDKETKKSRGFAFVEMDDSDAKKAISKLNGLDFGGRELKVNEAQEKQPR